jgi:hypothetical protein
VTAAEPVLLKQYKLLGALIDAPWATRLDHKISRHVIERYYAKFGNARASLRYLEVATGAERNKIIPSLRRIIDNGVISVMRHDKRLALGARLVGDFIEVADVFFLAMVHRVVALGGRPRYR